MHALSGREIFILPSCRGRIGKEKAESYDARDEEVG